MFMFISIYCIHDTTLHYTCFRCLSQVVHFHRSKGVEVFVSGVPASERQKVINMAPVRLIALVGGGIAQSLCRFVFVVACKCVQPRENPGRLLVGTEGKQSLLDGNKPVGAIRPKDVAPLGEACSPIALLNAAMKGEATPSKGFSRGSGHAGEKV